MRHPQRTYNILHTVRSLRIDGVVKVILRNVSASDSPEFRHYVCSMLPDDELAGEYRRRGFEPVFVGHRGLPFAPGSVLRLVRIMRRLEIDLVHANRTMDLGIAGVAARICGIPVVSSLHWLGRTKDHPEEEEPWWLQKAKKGTAVLLNRLLATRIVAVSSAVRDSFGDLPGFPVERTEIVYPGLSMELSVSDSAKCARLKRELGLDSSGPILLNVGRLVPVKGQKYLIPMMKRVRERWPHAVLLIAGEGHLRQLLEQQIQQHGLGGAIHLLGSRSDVDDLLALSDVLVVASESEAFGLPLLEAMRAAKPVVATRVGGMPEVVAEGASGYVVPRANPDALAAAVLRILDSPGRGAEMGKAGRRIALERFDIADSVRSLEQLYLGLIASRVSTGVLHRR